MAKKEKAIEMQRLESSTKTLRVTISGKTELCLNKMNARTVRELTREREDLPPLVQAPNKWEDVITAMHWYKPTGMVDTYLESTEEKLRELLETNSPCITTFGLKKSFAAAVTQNELDTYSTKFWATVNVVGNEKGLVPVTFSEWYLDEKLMAPPGKRGAPVLARLNCFRGWGATFAVEFMDTVYSADEIVHIINLAGFGQGIGSGRKSEKGRYNIVNIEG